MGDHEEPPPSYESQEQARTPFAAQAIREKSGGRTQPQQQRPVEQPQPQPQPQQEQQPQPQQEQQPQPQFHQDNENEDGGYVSLRTITEFAVLVIVLRILCDNFRIKAEIEKIVADIADNAQLQSGRIQETAERLSQRLDYPWYTWCSSWWRRN